MGATWGLAGAETIQVRAAGHQYADKMPVIDAMLDAVSDLIGALDADQRQRATWDFDADERLRWFYTPTDHGGLPFTEMDSAQQRLVWRLVSTGLSEAGFNTAAAIVGHENILDRVEGFGVDFGRMRGRDPQLYWIAIFGQPSAQGTWAWRFGGHHVSLNFTIADGAIVSATPCFMGADPASVPLLGPHLLRPLGSAEDLGRDLVHSLDSTQRSAAVVSSAPPADLIGVNRTVLTEGDHTLGLPFLWRGRFEKALDSLLGKMQTTLEASLGGTPEELAALAFSHRPKGIAAVGLSADQQQILRELLTTYVGRIHDDLADREHAKYAGAKIESLHFLWAGSTDIGDPHYYRIQGGDLFVEYDNAQRGGNHVHTVWRDLSSDFGGDPLAEHYTHDHH